MKADLVTLWRVYDDECERRSDGARMAPGRETAVAFEAACAEVGGTLGLTAREVRTRLIAGRRTGLNRMQSLAACERSVRTGEAA